MEWWSNGMGILHHSMTPLLHYSLNLWLRIGAATPLFLPAPAFVPHPRGFGRPARCGCSSVVEHLLAKEDVASSSLVTRSNSCFCGSR